MKKQLPAKRSVRQLVKWYGGLGAFPRGAMAGVLWFISFYGGAVLENQVQVLAEGKMYPGDLKHAASIVVVFLVMGIVTFQIRALKERIDAEERSRRETLAYAASQVDQHATQAAALNENSLEEALASGSREAFLKAVLDRTAAIQDIVTRVYTVFESRYGRSDLDENRVDFEVTFITRSYEDDGLTIPAAKNRRGMKPTSMTKRKGEPDLYKNTVAAQLYQSENPTTRIIADTEDSQVGYAEVYAGQKRRIKSTLVHPVFNRAHVICGVLVVHCNSVGFFTEGDRGFWEELLMIFDRRLAREKAVLDAAFGDGVDTLLGFSLPKPF